MGPVKTAPQLHRALPHFYVRVHAVLMTSLGSQFAAAVAAKDADAVRALVTDDVDFKGLTPGRLWEGGSPDELLVAIGQWFEPQDHIDELVEVVDGDPVADTEHVAYRLRVTTPDGPHAVAQQAYYRVDDDRISYLRVMCSGFRPIG